MNTTVTADDVESILTAEFDDRVYSVESDVVWVSGTNAHCPTVARRIADLLVEHDIPCSTVFDDDTVVFGGVQFRYGASA